MVPRNMVVFTSINFSTSCGYGSIPMKIPFLGGWTSILTQLFWCEQKGYKVLTHCHGLLPFCWGYLEGLLGISFFKVSLLRWLSDPFWGSVTSNWWLKRSLWRTRYMVPYGWWLYNDKNPIWLYKGYVYTWLYLNMVVLGRINPIRL